MKRMLMSGMVNGAVWGLITESAEVALHMAVLGVMVVELARMIYLSTFQQ